MFGGGFGLWYLIDQELFCSFGLDCFMPYHDRESYENLKELTSKFENLITFKYETHSATVLYIIAILLISVGLYSLHGCSKPALIDLNDCDREEVLKCVSSHRIETSIEALNLVIACQKDVCLRTND